MNLDVFCTTVIHSSGTSYGEAIKASDSKFSSLLKDFPGIFLFFVLRAFAWVCDVNSLQKNLLKRFLNSERILSSKVEQPELKSKKQFIERLVFPEVL